MSNIEKALELLERANALGLQKAEQSSLYAAILAEHGLHRAPPAVAEPRAVEVQQSLPLTTRTATEEVRASMPALRDAFDRYQRARAAGENGGSGVRMVYQAARTNLDSVRRMVAHVATAVEQCGGQGKLAERMTRDGLSVRTSDVVAWLESARVPDAFEAALLAAIVSTSPTASIEAAARARAVVDIYRAALGMKQTRTVHRAQGDNQ
jgi:hypothetical protein